MDTNYTRSATSYPSSHFDYLAYPTHHMHNTVMAMDADRLAAVAMMHQPTHTYADASHHNHYLPTTDLGEVNAHHQLTLSGSSRYSLHNYTNAANTILKTDMNANPLLPFREMTHPLVNQ